MSSMASATTAARSAARSLSLIAPLGLLFQSLMVRDLRIYSQAAQSEVCCYRDNVGLEADSQQPRGPSVGQLT